MKKNKLCVFVYDWVSKPITIDDVFPQRDPNNEYKYFLMSDLSIDEQKDLPLVYKNDGWTVTVKNIK